MSSKIYPAFSKQMLYRRLNGAKVTRYLQLLTLILFLSFGPNSQAQDPQKAVGVHGMVLFEFEGKIYASHMPLHHSIHSYQVILEIRLPPNIISRVNQRLKQRKLFSIAPEIFDLFDVKNNKLSNFTAKIFQGHFERGGQVIAENIDITIKDVLLFESIEANKNGRFYLLKQGDNSTLAIHQIGPLDSYDQIFGIRGNISKTLNFDSGINKPIDTLPLSKILELKAEDVELLYLETQDFRKRH
ncbi:MAG: hypothetical protein OQK04_15045 [Kangiellaceae bacterium]|nr:hypothetical protein [Kangiellaceae bacterium]MCW9000025.1 hypothetical protein [Kangiellaceae bacterium]